MKKPRRGHVVADADVHRFGDVVEVMPGAEPDEKVVVVQWTDGQREEVSSSWLFGSNKFDFWVQRPAPGSVPQARIRR